MPKIAKTTWCHQATQFNAIKSDATRCFAALEVFVVFPFSRKLQQYSSSGITSNYQFATLMQKGHFLSQILLYIWNVENPIDEFTTWKLARKLAKFSDHSRNNITNLSSGRRHDCQGSQPLADSVGTILDFCRAPAPMIKCMYYKWVRITEMILTMHKTIWLNWYT